MADWDAAHTGGLGSMDDLGLSSGRRLGPRRIAANVASIEGVPEELLGGVDREWAFAWARKGYDVYAYRDERGKWYLWLATRCMELGRVRAGAVPRSSRSSRSWSGADRCH